MKVINRFLISTGLVLSLAACATTEVEKESVISNEQKEEIVEETIAAPTEEELYSQLIKDDVTITFISGPSVTNLNKSFAKPYIFAVKHADSSAYSDFDIEITYPASKSQTGLDYASQIIKSDSQGLVTYNPEKAAFSANAFVSAKPALLYDDENVKAAAAEKEVKAPYQVKSDIASKGAVLFIWDYNEKGRPVNNSTHVQSEFRTRGITLVGNGPVNETSYIGKNSALYRDTYEIIGGDAYGYLISGTIKFANPVTADGDEYVCSLIAEITGIKMKDGSQIFTGSYSHEARGKNWNESTSKCKEELAKIIVDNLVFGL
ncbi:MAG: hypothetical protein K5681_05400 [Treponema sp.]|nr:hypothetical protein [Treponema sp.]